jgi:glucuronate isomerase
MTDIREKIYDEELEKLKEVSDKDKQEFADLMGYIKKGEEYYNREGQKIENVDEEGIKVALASARADKQVINEVATLI